MNVLYNQLVINDPIRSDATCCTGCKCSQCKPSLKYLGANSQLSEFIMNHQAPVKATVDPSDILLPNEPLFPTTNFDTKAHLRKAQKRLADEASVPDVDEHGDLLIPPSLIPRRIECEICVGAGKIFNQISEEFDECLACEAKGFLDGSESHADVDYTVTPFSRIKGDTPTVGNQRSDDDPLVMPLLLEGENYA